MNDRLSATMRVTALGLCCISFSALAQDDPRYPQAVKPAAPVAAEPAEPEIETIAQATPLPPPRPGELRPSAAPATAPSTSIGPPLTITTIPAFAPPTDQRRAGYDPLRPRRVMLSAPTSLSDRPAPVRPDDKARVTEPEADDPTDPQSATAPPEAKPRQPDAPTTDLEAAFLVHQTDRVVTRCFPADLKRVIQRMARHFRSPVIVTSGYRSRGKKGSLHRTCRAADIQIAGIRPSQIVAFAKDQPEIGGIGTYSYTRSVHIDVREDKMSWHGNRGRGWFRTGKTITAAVSGARIPAYQNTMRDIVSDR